MVLIIVKKGTNMLSGTVKWFNNKKGYGFIKTPENEKDIFMVAQHEPLTAGRVQRCKEGIEGIKIRAFHMLVKKYRR